MGTTATTSAIDNMSIEAIVAEMIAISKDLAQQYQGLGLNLSTSDDLSNLVPMNILASSEDIQRGSSTSSNNSLKRNTSLNTSFNGARTFGSLATMLAASTAANRKMMYEPEKVPTIGTAVATEDNDSDDEESNLFQSFVTTTTTTTTTATAAAVSTNVDTQYQSFAQQANPTTSSSVSTSSSQEGHRIKSDGVVDEGIVHPSCSQISMASCSSYELEEGDIIVEKVIFKLSKLFKLYV